MEAIEIILIVFILSMLLYGVSKFFEHLNREHWKEMDNLDDEIKNL